MRKKKYLVCGACLVAAVVVVDLFLDPGSVHIIFQAEVSTIGPQEMRVNLELEFAIILPSDLV
jgi:hypothetical protein